MNGDKVILQLKDWGDVQVFLSDGFTGLSYIALWLLCGSMVIYFLQLITGFLFTVLLMLVFTIIDANLEESLGWLFSNYRGFYYYFGVPYLIFAVLFSCGFLKRQCNWTTLGPKPKVITKN